jgi:hypothetical protein
MKQKARMDSKMKTVVQRMTEIMMVSSIASTVVSQSQKIGTA